MKSVEQYDNYLFVFAHPDDEIYTVCLMHRLVVAGKMVTAVFITNGDAGENAEGREAELDKSMKVIGIAPQNTVKLGYPEGSVLQGLPSIFADIDDLAAKIHPSCLIGMDYEGGHVGHDSASFLTARLAGNIALPHYVFPVYHLEDGLRKAADFIPGRQPTDIIKLTAREAEIKAKALAAHAGQADHFLRLQQRDPTYYDRLYAREVYRRVSEPIDFNQPPALEIDYSRSGVAFENFRTAVDTLSE